MIFNGFPIWIVSLAALVSSGLLLASHFLQMRQDRRVVPTVLFWQQAVSPSKRNVLFGKLGAIKVLFFLLAIIWLILFSMLSPAISPLDRTIIIIDTSAATDLVEAQKYARALVLQSDRSAVLTAGKDINVHANLNDSRKTALAAIAQITQSRSPYSAVPQAIREAMAIEQRAKIVLLSGQHLQVRPEITMIACPTTADAIDREPLKVSFPEAMQLPAKLYCRVDERYDYCDDQSEADFVMDDLDFGDGESRYDPQFVQLLSDALDKNAGLSYRHPVQAAPLPESAPKPVPASFAWTFDKTVYTLILVLLLLEIYLVKNRQLI